MDRIETTPAPAPAFLPTPAAIQALTHLEVMLDQVTPHIEETLRLVNEITAIDNETRSGLAHPLDAFEGMAPDLLGAVATRPHLGVSVNFDSARVRRQIGAASRITALLGKIKDLGQRLTDARAVELSEAWRGCLDVYGVAKIAQRKDPGLRAVIEPMAEIFRNRASPKPKAASPAIEATPDAGEE